MPIFRLTPIAVHLADAAWQKRTHHTAVFARAVDDRAARTLGSHACRAWVESRRAHRSFWVSPWEDPHLVTCVQGDESGYAEEGRDTMLGPPPDDETCSARGAAPDAIFGVWEGGVKYTTRLRSFAVYL